MNDTHSSDAPVSPPEAVTPAANDAAGQPSAAGAEPVALPWADVGAETLQLVRLAPLPVDRATGARPLRFVQVGRAERHGGTVSLLRLDIQLPGQRVHKEQNRLDVWVNHGKREIRTEPKNGLVVEPPNRGLGRFMMAQGILWVQKRWPDYQINSQVVPGKDALNEEARLRRDHALKGQGLEVDYPEAAHSKARYKAAAASSLQAGWNAEKVQMVDILEAANMLQQAEARLQEMEIKLHRTEETLARHRRDEGGLKFTIACLIIFSIFQAVLLIWMAARH